MREKGGLAMGLVPPARLPLQLAVQLLLVPFSASQQHPPGSTGWPVEGSAGPGIVQVSLGTSFQGAIDSPGGSVWYSFAAANNRTRGICSFVLCADATDGLSCEARRRIRDKHRAGRPR